jgi:PPOX class probable F420-dependent enzyme
VKVALADGFSTELVDFWSERHLATLTTLRPDGSPHVVPVGATVDLPAGIAWVICSSTSRKARNIAEALSPARAVLCQVDGRRWSSVEGVAMLHADLDAVAEAERRYAERYRRPRPNPARVVIEIHLDRRLGLN